MKNALRARTISRAQTPARRAAGSIRLAAVGAAAALATLLPLTASGTPHQRLYIGTNLALTGPMTSAGTFVASGAIGDSGTVAVDHLAFVPIGNGDSAELSGNETFTSASGSIVTRFEGIAFPLSSQHQVGKGRFQIVSTSGAYEGLKGHGTFLIVVDQASNVLLGTEEGSVDR
jgi:hypothetical protein